MSQPITEITIASNLTTTRRINLKMKSTQYRWQTKRKILEDMFELVVISLLKATLSGLVILQNSNSDFFSITP